MSASTKTAIIILVIITLILGSYAVWYRTNRGVSGALHPGATGTKKGKATTATTYNNLTEK